MMKNLIIIGSGGMGREVFDLATKCTGFKSEFVIKGFLDDNVNALNSFNGYPPVIGKILDYKIDVNDIFICSVGNVQSKKKYIRSIMEKGGEFISLIHPSASISKNVEIGVGCVILQNATIGSDAKIGDHVLIQISTVIGHDARIGDYSRIDCFAVCVGGVIIEDLVTIHTSAIINHNVKVRKKSTVGAGSFVLRNVKESTTVYGNPAVLLK